VTATTVAAPEILEAQGPNIERSPVYALSLILPGWSSFRRLSHNEEI
jgi:hypothetical protein